MAVGPKMGPAVVGRPPGVPEWRLNLTSSDPPSVRRMILVDFHQMTSATVAGPSSLLASARNPTETKGTVFGSNTAAGDLHYFKASLRNESNGTCSAFRKIFLRYRRRFVTSSACWSGASASACATTRATGAASGDLHYFKASLRNESNGTCSAILRYRRRFVTSSACWSGALDWLRLIGNFHSAPFSGRSSEAAVSAQLELEKFSWGCRGRAL